KQIFPDHLFSIEDSMLKLNSSRITLKLETKIKDSQTRHQSILLILKEAPKPLIAQTIVERLGASKRTVQNDLKQLIDQGLVKRVGRGRNCCYRACFTQSPV
ncbi:MAG: HTH domain-containing protein, partial [Bdellovibrionales bacterium]|nr:HTH domain-containing protein [Bdellovibrionales bacterium]